MGGHSSYGWIYGYSPSSTSSAWPFLLQLHTIMDKFHQGDRALHLASTKRALVLGLISRIDVYTFPASAKVSAFVEADCCVFQTAALQLKVLKVDLISFVARASFFSIVSSACFSLLYLWSRGQGFFSIVSSASWLSYFVDTSLTSPLTDPILLPSWFQTHMLASGLTVGSVAVVMIFVVVVNVIRTFCGVPPDWLPSWLPF